MGNTALVSGTAAAVILGATLIIGPWVFNIPPNFFGKLFLAVIGILFVYFGLYFSKG